LGGVTRVSAPIHLLLPDLIGCFCAVCHGSPPNHWRSGHPLPSFPKSVMTGLCGRSSASGKRLRSSFDAAGGRFFARHGPTARTVELAATMVHKGRPMTNKSVARAGFLQPNALTGPARSSPGQPAMKKNGERRCATRPGRGRPRDSSIREPWRRPSSSPTPARRWQMMPVASDHISRPGSERAISAALLAARISALPGFLSVLRAFARTVPQLARAG